MADTPEENQEIMKVLFGAQQDLIDGFIETFQKIKRLAGESGVEAASLFGNGFAKGAEAVNRQFAASFDVSKIFAKQMGDVERDFKLTTENLSSVFEDSGLRDMLIDLGIDPESLGQVQDSIGQLVNKDFAVNLGVYWAADKAFDGIEKITSRMKAMEDKILSVSKSGEKALRGMLSPLSDDRPYKSLTDGIAAYRNEILDTVMEFGIAREDVQTGFASLSSTGLGIEQIQKLKVEASESGESFKGLQAAFLASKATGLELDDVAKQLNMRIRTLGVDVNDAANVFETLQRVQANTTLSIQKVNEAITAGQESMKFFGDATDSSATIFKTLLNSLGRGREELAKPLFDQVIKGLSGMEIGMSSVIGMATGIGGGAGPIGAGLRVEEALTTGEGLEEVLQGVADQIEQFSGSELLTRKEAVDTGQEQQFEIQRRLLEQFLGVRGGQQQNLVLEALQQADFGAVREQLSPTGGGLTTGMAEETMAIQEGAIGRLTNRLEAITQAGLTENLADNVTQASKGINAGAKDFSAVAENLRKYMDEGEKGFAQLKDIFEGRTEGTLKRTTKRAQEDVVGVFDAGAAPVGKSAEELNSVSNALPKAGMKFAEQLEMLSSMMANVGSAEELNSLRETMTRIGFKGADKLELSASERLDDVRKGIASAIERQEKRNESGDRKVGASGGTPREQEVTVMFKAEMDPNSGFINLTPVIENIARPIAKKEAENLAGAPRE